MSMVFGHVLKGAAYLAVDECGASYDIKTRKKSISTKKIDKAIQLDNHTVLAAIGVTAFAEQVKNFAKGWWDEVNGDIEAFVKKIEVLCNLLKNNMPSRIDEVLKTNSSGHIVIIIACYDTKRNKPVIYGITDFDNYDIKSIDEDDHTIAKSALPDPLMWQIINGIKAPTVKQYVKALFMGCHVLAPEISATHKLFRIDRKGVEEVC